MVSVKKFYRFYLIGSIQYFFNFLLLKLFSKSPMEVLAILLLFPILVPRFIERVVEPLISYLWAHEEKLERDKGSSACR